MQSSPPPADKVIRHADMSLYAFPQLRWSFSNFRQLMPTRSVWRGDGQQRAQRRPVVSMIASGVQSAALPLKLKRQGVLLSLSRPSTK